MPEYDKRISLIAEFALLLVRRNISFTYSANTAVFINAGHDDFPFDKVALLNKQLVFSKGQFKVPDVEIISFLMLWS